VNNLICIETFSDFPQLGRFTLRTEGEKLILALCSCGIHDVSIRCHMDYSVLQEKQLQWERLPVFYKYLNNFWHKR
jgi:hypothetical protein